MLDIKDELGEGRAGGGMLTRGLPRGTGLVKHLPKGSGTLLWVQVSAAGPCQTEQLSPRLQLMNLYLTTLTPGPRALILVTESLPAFWFESCSTQLQPNC